MCSYSTPGTMSGFGGPRLGRVTILWSREGYQSVVICRSRVYVVAMSMNSGLLYRTPRVLFLSRFAEAYSPGMTLLAGV